MSSRLVIPRVYDASVTAHTPAINCTLEPGPIEPSTTRPAQLEKGTGAQVVFLGRTRPERHPEFGELEALDYEAHETLALRSMREICAELIEEFGLLSISLTHSVHRVVVGEVSIELQVSAPHRAEAFSACAAGIDRLKERVPIWKRECWQHGETWSQQSQMFHHDGVS